MSTRVRRRASGELPFSAQPSSNGKESKGLSVVPFQKQMREGKINGRLISRNKYDGPHKELLQAFDTYATQQNDPFSDFYDAVTGATTTLPLIKPKYDPYALLRLPNQNNILAQCIAAMQTNIEGFGHTLVYIGPKGSETSAPALAEKQRIEDLLSQPNPDETFREIREKMRSDFESVGYGTLEIGRDQDGNILFINHAFSYSFRLTKQDIEPTEVDIWIRRKGKYVQETIKKRFRRFVQLSRGGGNGLSQRRYFKEFGDPRPIDPETGLEDTKGKLSEDQLASEILFVSRYVPGEVYGLPRYINQLPSILGSRESELTNLQFFKDNAIPALAVLVSGGLLTEETVEAIKGGFQNKGMDSMNRVLVLEANAVSDYTNIDSSTPTVPRLDIKPLGGQRQKDELFQNYDKNAQDKIRSSFRLPPVFLGITSDYTRATVEASIEVADAQVFSPERLKMDTLVNMKLLLYDGRPPEFWKFRSNPAKLVSGSVLLDALGKFEEVGAMTPNLAISMANELLDLRIPTKTEAWADMPFEFVKALILTGKLRPTEASSLPDGLVPDDGGNGGKGGPTIADVSAAKAMILGRKSAPKVRVRYRSR